jgi:hypothetical protein
VSSSVKLFGTSLRQGYDDALDGFKEYIESKGEQLTESIEDRI